ncbi:MAG: prepilin-type N-terminal cleavage/methylation domain-containing protein [Candidatus Shapirobacteria bacterium]|nr:prepilin-type N-terminal cleavage/methylation domain-containing protein [Candidatus Shapirobacteria bacterium]MDD3002313.1 prepilin-type N-terminal cleavage/methylation domain-containing protein [Candidatus Shapirobacteria bacterium]MDD4382682.1 prepilin-type N-terminal cleavage/methylation domain-containing protein [Candidatus Shapirobacteria bacterium]
MRGFTLVELLIVIALIAILSVAVLATINPIEQSNKARDAAQKNDAAEVLGALERYYTSQNGYPWNNSSIGTTVAQGTVVAIGSSSPLFGVIGAGSSGGVLIATSELKSSFMGKKPFVATGDAIDKMYVYHNGTDSNYVCYIPKATANRTTGGSVNPNLKCMTLSESGTASLKNAGDTGCSNTNVWTASTASDMGTGKANLLCVPEGRIE